MAIISINFKFAVLQNHHGNTIGIIYREIKSSYDLLIISKIIKIFSFRLVPERIAAGELSLKFSEMISLNKFYFRRNSRLIFVENIDCNSPQATKTKFLGDRFPCFAMIACLSELGLKGERKQFPKTLIT